VLRPPKRTHRPALRVEEAGLFLRRLADYPGKAETRLAVLLLLLTAARPGEIQRARWEEIDLTARAWRIPAAKMKARRDHVVYLPRQAVDMLEELRTITGHSPWLFPGPSKRFRHISENTLAKAFQVLLPERHIVPHGCRALFSTHANESHRFAPDVIEAALAHAEKDPVRAAYNRAEYLHKRRELMQWWADELDALRRGA
jgi:integrase